MQLAKLALFPTLLLLGCEESAGPSEKPESKGPLVGKWEEQVPDTTTAEGNSVYQARTSFGAKWISDTLHFVSDSTYTNGLDRITSAPAFRYLLRSDTLISWNPNASYDTSKIPFEVTNDSLFFGDRDAVYRQHYIRI